MLNYLLFALLLTASQDDSTTYPSHAACNADCTRMQGECELETDIDSCAGPKLLCHERCDRWLIEGKFCIPRCEKQYNRCLNAPFSTIASCDWSLSACSSACEEAAFQ